MIRPKAALHSILFSTLTAALLLSFAFPDGAGAFDPEVFRELASKNMPPTHLDRLPLATFRVPVDITDLSPAFTGGELIVDCAAYYVDGGSFKGLVYGRAVRKGLLTGPHYQGMVSVPVHDLMGQLTGQPRGICLAMVQQGGTCMSLGTACVQGPCDVPLLTAEYSFCDQNIFEALIKNRRRPIGGQ